MHLILCILLVQQMEWVDLKNTRSDNFKINLSVSPQTVIHFKKANSSIHCRMAKTTKYRVLKGIISPYEQHKSWRHTSNDGCTGAVWGSDSDHECTQHVIIRCRGECVSSGSEVLLSDSAAHTTIWRLRKVIVGPTGTDSEGCGFFRRTSNFSVKTQLYLIF
jgi:hypothetical protein